MAFSSGPIRFGKMPDEPGGDIEWSDHGFTGEVQLAPDPDAQDVVAVWPITGGTITFEVEITDAMRRNMARALRIPHRVLRARLPSIPGGRRHHARYRARKARR